MGVIDDVAAAGMLVGGIYVAAGEGSGAASMLIAPGIGLGIQGVISTIHGALDDRRALRNPGAAAAGHALLTAGTTLASTGLGIILVNYLPNSPHEFYGELLGGIVMGTSVVFLAPAIPLIAYGELTAEPGTRSAEQPMIPSLTVVGGPGQLRLVGRF